MQPLAPTIVLLMIFISAAVMSNYVLGAMIGQINRKQTERGQVSYFGFTLPKLLKIISSYRHLYPEGRLLILFFGLAVVAVGALFGLVPLLFPFIFRGA